VPIATNAPQQTALLFDHLVGAVEAGELNGVLAQMSKSSSQFVKGKRAA
jgi:hypothetical protein